jgi:hypothetical protein
MIKNTSSKMYDIDDLQSIASEESGRVKIHSYYMKQFDSGCSSVSALELQKMTGANNQPQASTSNEPHCCACGNKSGVQDAFIILSCNHIYHVQCLTNVHFSDVSKFTSIDSEFFNTRKCPSCTKNIPYEEQMYLHSKFLSSTKDHIVKHQDAIGKLENQLQRIKDELRVCYEYKNKLEKEREKSKEIVTMLTTMM